MQLTTQEKSFIEKRNKFARNWPLVGTIMLLIFAILGVWLFWSIPLLVNPWFVISQLKANAVPEPTLLLMAVILPVSMLMCLVVVVTFILLTFAVFSKERKYISIIHRLTGDQSEKSDLR